MNTHNTQGELKMENTMRIPFITAEKLEKFIAKKHFTKKLNSGRVAKISTFNKESSIAKFLESRNLLKLSEEIVYTDKKVFLIKWLGSFESDFRQFDLNYKWQIQEVSL